MIKLIYQENIMRNQNQKVFFGQGGFTLIELLVVVAIIALLSSIALIALMSARQKGRDSKRLSDMVQMNTALELYFATNKGYPSGPAGIPSPLVPSVTSSLPAAPTPPDGNCETMNYPSPVPSGTNGSVYYYYPSGTPFLNPDGSTLVYPSYSYYFCLGNQTGNFSSGIHILTPTGVQ
ncbi:MAG TPA: type II secretion system protein [Patescibacteria group bacterium]|nr:type II secretion system protein [Patescibacteria group bacterium]